MKKKVKKLELNKETVRNLTTDDLKKIAGGTVETIPVTICNSCRPTICPYPSFLADTRCAGSQGPAHLFQRICTATSSSYRPRRRISSSWLPRSTTTP